MRLVHTSDLHLFAGRPFEEDLRMVRNLAANAVALGADVLAVAGDLFDHNRVPHAPAGDLLAALAEPGIRVVVLPGNHDPLTSGSIYRRLLRPANLFVLGLDGSSFAVDATWTVTGRAHLDYANFAPLDLAPDDAPEGERIVLAHGHFDLADDARASHRPGWLITAADLDRTAARYIGLGHWDRAYVVRPAAPPTYYSGSPWFAQTVNLVTALAGEDVRVERAPIREGSWVR